MATPSVFISYSHDSPEHKDWVLRLAIDLRERGVDASIDQWDLTPGQDIAAFMQTGILSSDRVILVCSENYVRKAEGGLGGVGFERLIVTGEVIQNLDTKKFIPLVRGNPTGPRVPRFLGPRLYIDFTEDAAYEARREELLRELHGTPARIKPLLGANPFSGDSPAIAKEADEAAVNRAKTIAIFKLKLRMLEEQIYPQEARLAGLRKGTKKWSEAQAELQTLVGQRDKFSASLGRIEMRNQGTAKS
jgi:hypothetical protein